MPIKSKRLGGQVIESANNPVHYFRDAGQRFFSESLPPSRKLNTDTLNVRSEKRDPGEKCGRRAAGVGKAQQPHRGTRPRLGNEEI
jgi:hypothetical protein